VIRRAYCLKCLIDVFEKYSKSVAAFLPDSVRYGTDWYRKFR